MRRPWRTPKASICRPILCLKSVTRPMRGSWPTPENCSQSFCPRRNRTGASSESSDAFSEPGPVALVVDFALRSGAVSGNPSRHAVAQLDHEPSAELLPRNLCHLLHAEQLSGCADDCSLCREDGSGAEARASAARGCGEGFKC